MKKNLIFALLVIFGSATYLYYNQESSNNDFSIQSPLPTLLTKTFPRLLAGVGAWEPRDKIINSSLKKPEIVAAASVVYDLTEDKYTFRQDHKKRVPIASLTKIMTAIVALDNMDLSQEIRIDKKAAEIGEDTMGLSIDEQLSLKELLYGLMLNSGNDAAEAIAAASPFGRANFVYLMNKKAEDLGLTDTHFTNPTGLEGDGKQYSTVYDLLLITRYALQNPTFAEVVATYQHDIEATNKHKAYMLYNETNLITSYPGVKGVKTGYTDEAGMCLVTYLEYDGRKIIAVLLNASNRRQEMKDLLDYSLKSVGVKPPPHP